MTEMAAGYTGYQRDRQGFVYAPSHGQGHGCPTIECVSPYAPLRPLQPCHMQKGCSGLLTMHASLNGAPPYHGFRVLYSCTCTRVIVFVRLCCDLATDTRFCTLRRVLEPIAGINIILGRARPKLIRHGSQQLGMS